MAKIRAVLDQETWVEVDVPDEFQAIVTSLFSSQLLISEDQDGGQVNVVESYSDVVASNHDSQVDTGRQAEELSKDNTSKKRRTPKTESANTVAQINNSNVNERGKSASQTLSYNDVSYHMVNWLVSFFCFLGFNYVCNWSVTFCFLVCSFSAHLVLCLYSCLL